MPSSEDCFQAQFMVKRWAIEALIKKGHRRDSAELAIAYMSYEDQVRLAEEIRGPIYRGPYSPF